MEYPIKVVIADDHEIFRDGFKLLFKNIPEIMQIGEAANGKELIEIVHKSPPDVVITDIQMQPMNGIEATTYITDNFPTVKVIALAMFNEISDVVEMIDAGAQGYLLKETDKTEIIEAILQVAEGNSYFCKSTRQKMKKFFSVRDVSTNSRRRKDNLLSDKEIEIVRLICQEYSSKQIGADLDLNFRTIQWYRDGIMEKIGVKTLVGIVTYALRHHIFELDDLE